MEERRKIKISNPEKVLQVKDVTEGPFRQFLIPVGSFFLALVIAYFWWGRQPAPASQPEIPTISVPGEQLVVEESVDGVFRRSVSLREVFTSLEVPSAAREYLFGLPNLTADDVVEAGRPYRLVYGEGADREARSFTFERDEATLYKIRFQPYATLEVIQREISERQVAYAGIITKNFWLAVLESDSLHHSLIPLAEEALKWTVDLFHLAPGDRFKLVYTEQLRDGEVMGVKQLDAAHIETSERTYTIYGMPVRKDSIIYVDYNGETVRRRFLRAPVKFGIISSPFSPMREHPVTGVNKRHGGTDFAAPSGTPIQALADGKLERQAKGQFNGNYVELTHDAVYSTMYLHLKDFAPGLKVGDRVRQGQVIGYVGSTGQSTGPHVCLRFRENDDEVDFQLYRDQERTSVPVGGLGGFSDRRDDLLERLEQLEYREILF